MSDRPARLVLAAAVAAVTLGFAATARADDDACSSCSSAGGEMTLISADDPKATAAPAEELLAKYNAIQLPRPDMSRREDQAYVREFQAKQREAMTEKAKVGREFVMAYPGHDQAAKVFNETMSARMFMLNEAEQVSADIKTLLARDDVSDGFKKSLELAEVNVSMGGRNADADAAWAKVTALKDKYPGDAQVARAMAQVAEASKGEQQVSRLKETLAAFPDSPATKYTKGKLRQAEGVGKPFEISFTDAISGKEITSSDLKGKVVVVDFWAVWCGPCVAEMPTMKKLYAEYKDKGVEFVGISLDYPEDKGGLDMLKKFVAENEIGWPQYYQGKHWEGEFSSAWGINSIPAIFILDADGNLHSTQARGQLEKMIPELIAKRDGGNARQAAAE